MKKIFIAFTILLTATPSYACTTYNVTDHIGTLSNGYDMYWFESDCYHGGVHKIKKEVYFDREDFTLGTIIHEAVHMADRMYPDRSMMEERANEVQSRFFEMVFSIILNLEYGN